MGIRLLQIAAIAAVAVSVAACDPTPGDTTTTVSDDTTTTAPLPVQAGSSVVVATTQIAPVSGYTIGFDLEDSDMDHAEIIEQWLPEDLNTTSVRAVAVSEQDDRIVVLSVIPPAGIRGYPWLAELVAAEAGDTSASEAASPTDVIEVDAGGTDLFIWTNGDGFLITAGDSPDAAQDYLTAMADSDTPNGIWTEGTCLALDQDDVTGFGTLPWAPFPRDMVASCDDEHHAEVIFADVSGVAADAYDEDRISYDRAYVCDKAYNEAIGDQAQHMPSLVTYAPDADEWERGDRYLACVIRVPAASGGEEPFVGRITERDDLAFDPDVGTCTSNVFTIEVRCNRPHPFQFVGSVTANLDTYPADRTAFDSFCELLTDTLVDGERITIIAQDIEPWSFEQGSRQVRCFAGVLEEGLFVDVAGSFFDRWRVLSGEGLPA